MSFDRLWGAFRALLRAELKEIPYLGMYEYVIVSSEPGFIDARPASDFGLPSLSRVPILPSVLAATATGSVGSSCVIAFLDGQSTKPVCVSLSKIDHGIIAAGSRGVARLSDTIVLGYCLWDATTHTLYFSPAVLGPTLTVYAPWAVFPAGTTVAYFLPNPASPVAPFPGTPGSAWDGQISSSSTVVTCG